MVFRCSDLKGFGLSAGSSWITGADLHWKGPGDPGSGGGLLLLTLLLPLPGLWWQSKGNGEGARLLAGFFPPLQLKGNIGHHQPSGCSTLWLIGVAVLPTPWHCWHSWLSQQDGRDWQDGKRQ